MPVAGRWSVASGGAGGDLALVGGKQMHLQVGGHLCHYFTTQVVK